MKRVGRLKELENKEPVKRDIDEDIWMAHFLSKDAELIPCLVNLSSTLQGLRPASRLEDAMASLDLGSRTEMENGM